MRAALLALDQAKVRFDEYRADTLSLNNRRSAEIPKTKGPSVKLKPITQSCPECGERYNVLFIERETFECRKCHSPLLITKLILARLISLFCAFILPIPLMLVERTNLWGLFCLLLGIFIYINMVSIVKCEGLDASGS